MTTPRQLNHAAIAHAIRDCELNAPHQVPLLQAALHGAIGLLVLSRTCQARTDLLIGHPSIVLVPDDDHDSTGPDGWAGRADVARWAEHAIIHAAAGDVEHYRTAVLLALRVGRLVFVETDSAHAFAWHKVFADRNIPTLNILARGGVHPLPPERGRLH